MKTIIANNDQTLFDLCLQGTGSIAAVFDLLDANPGLHLDLSVPAGFKVIVPGVSGDPKVLDYYTRKGIMPVTGLGNEVIVTQNDLNTMKQDLNYNLASGNKEFPGVKLNFLYDQLTVQVVYEGITASTVVVSVDQSLDGVNWAAIPYVNYILDKTKTVHVFNVIGIHTDFVRLHIEVPDPSDGTINSVTWKT